MCRTMTKYDLIQHNAGLMKANSELYDEVRRYRKLWIDSTEREQELITTGKRLNRKYEELLVETHKKDGHIKSLESKLLKINPACDEKGDDRCGTCPDCMREKIRQLTMQLDNMQRTHVPRKTMQNKVKHAKADARKKMQRLRQPPCYEEYLAQLGPPPPYSR